MKDLQLIKNEIQYGIDMMLDIHEEIGHVWKMPSALSCIAYTCTEAAEIIDSVAAQLDGAEHHRTNDKERNWKKEVVDTIMMISRYCIVSNTSVDELFEQFEQFDLAILSDLELGAYNAITLEHEVASVGFYVQWLVSKVGVDMMAEINEEFNIPLSVSLFVLFSLLGKGEYPTLLAEKLESKKRKILNV